MLLYLYLKLLFCMVYQLLNYWQRNKVFLWVFLLSGIGVICSNCGLCKGVVESLVVKAFITQLKYACVNCIPGRFCFLLYAKCVVWPLFLSSFHRKKFSNGKVCGRKRSRMGAFLFFFACVHKIINQVVLSPSSSPSSFLAWLAEGEGGGDSWGPNQKPPFLFSLLSPPPHHCLPEKPPSLLLRRCQLEEENKDHLHYVTKLLQNSF